MRKLVGPTDVADFDNPGGGLVFPYLDAAVYGSVFDFGSGCGRIARQLIQQVPRPRRYVGVDLHAGMVQWCRRNLAPAASGFEFHHHDVYNAAFNPDRSKPDALPFPVADRSFSLVIAWSVFTHLTQRQAEHYLREVGRILAPGGAFLSTWFLFDKRHFPMLKEGSDALYVSDLDPSAAVLFDRRWLRTESRAAGLVIYSVTPPEVRGYQWLLLMADRNADYREASFPPDTAPIGEVKLSTMPRNPSAIGCERTPRVPDRRRWRLRMRRRRKTEA